MKSYISCADTAKLVRQALKRAFPRTVFSVKSKTYSGGASIRVNWTDGPATKTVEAVTGVFAGSRFDGMIDLKYSVTHWLLPDASVVLANDPGTWNNGGSNPPADNPKPHPDARSVRFMADFVFCTRDYSAPVMQKVADSVCAKYGFDPLKVVTTKYGLDYVGDLYQRQQNWAPDLKDLMHREREALDLFN